MLDDDRPEIPLSARAPKPVPPYKAFPDPLGNVLLAGSVNLLSGASGVGKTAFLTWLIEHFQRQHQILGIRPTPIPFQGWISADRSWERSTKRWFETAEIQAPKSYSLMDDAGFSKHRLRNRKDRLAILDEMFAAVSPTGDGKFPAGSIVYVDPIALFLGGNLNDYDTCAVACMEIRERCLDKQFTLIATAHTAKQQADKKQRYLRIQDRILGSAALLGYSDTQLYLGSPDEMGIPYYTFFWGPHHAPSQAFAFQRDSRGLFIPMHELTAPDPPPGGAWIAEHLGETAGQSLLTAQIVEEGEHRGLSRATVMRQLKDAREEGLVVREDRGRYRLGSVN